MPEYYCLSNSANRYLSISNPHTPSQFWLFLPYSGNKTRQSWGHLHTESHSKVLFK